MDYQVYSGHELVKAWGADLIPVGAFDVGVTGATFGDYINDEIKFNLKKDVDK